MSGYDIEKRHHYTFEEIKYTGPEGQEFWLARELSKVLEYSEFRNFLPVIEKAKTACRNSGQVVADHIVEVHEMVSVAV